MPLTAISIRNAKPKDKTYRLFDGGGMYLEVTPKGNRYWRLKYRFGGKEKRLSMGVFPEVSLKEARERRDEARKLLRDGIDPSAYKQVTKEIDQAHFANSFEAVAREWMLKQAEVWTQSHARTVVQRLEKNVFPWIGSRPISEVKAKELLAILRRTEDRGALETAHRVLVIFGQVFRYGVATDRIESDPSRDLRGALRPVKSNHFAAVTEPSEVGQLLRILDGYEGSFVTKCALRLAPLVFVRPGELRQAEWKDIDLEEAQWSFVVAKTQTPHIVPLARQSVEILSDLYPLTGKGKWVFPGARSNGRPMSNNALLAAMRTLGIPKEKTTVHGFRAMARTLLDEKLGERVDLIEHQLAHTVKDPLGRAYNRTKHLPERRAMMQRWADYLDELKNAEN